MTANCYLFLCAWERITMAIYQNAGGAIGASRCCHRASVYRCSPELIANRQPVGGFQVSLLTDCRRNFFDGLTTRPSAMSRPALAKEWGMTRARSAARYLAGLLGVYEARCCGPPRTASGGKKIIILSTLCVRCRRDGHRVVKDRQHAACDPFMTGDRPRRRDANAIAMNVGFNPAPPPTKPW